MHDNHNGNSIAFATFFFWFLWKLRASAVGNNLICFGYYLWLGNLYSGAGPAKVSKQCESAGFCRTLTTLRSRLQFNERLRASAVAAQSHFGQNSLWIFRSSVCSSERQ